jgi:hypothetical protein
MKDHLYSLTVGQIDPPIVEMYHQYRNDELREVCNFGFGFGPGQASAQQMQLQAWLIVEIQGKASDHVYVSSSHFL